MAKSRKKRKGNAKKPSTTVGWIVLVFCVLFALFQFLQPDLEERVYGEEQTVTSEETQTDIQTDTQTDTQSVPVTEGERSLTVHFLDVGQGDSALLMSGGETMLIDGGPRSAGDGLVEDLAELGVTHLDYMVATHAHEDHIGGLPDVLDAVTVETCLLTDDVADSKIYETFLTSLDEQDVTVTVPEAGDEIVFGDCTITVLGPVSVSQEHNENSMVLKVTCGDEAYLFTGDMEGEEEREMLDLGDALSSNILKVPHHGSEYTCNDPFLNAVSPRIAIISCAEGNSYGHPHAPLLERLEERDIEIYRTDLNGRITCVTTVSEQGTDTVITCERKGE